MREQSDSKVELKSLAPVLPGLFTFGNLLCGFLALLHTMGPNPFFAAWFIFLGAFLDALDGKVARATKGATPLGIQLDSLADFLTFGIAPVALMRAVGLFDLRDWKLAIGLLYIFAAAFRLARFNVSAGLKGAEYFIGLSTPAAAVTVASGLLFIEEVWPPIYGTGALGGVAVLAWLMVSNVKYPRKIPRIDLSKKRNLLWIIPAIIIILALILFPIYVIYPIILIYVGYGLFREIVHSLSRRKENDDESIYGGSNRAED